MGVPQLLLFVFLLISARTLEALTLGVRLELERSTHRLIFLSSRKDFRQLAVVVGDYLFVICYDNELGMRHTSEPRLGSTTTALAADLD